MKKGPWWKVKKEKKRIEKGARGSENGAATNQPRGGKNVRFKETVEEDPGVERLHPGGGENPRNKKRLATNSKRAKDLATNVSAVGADGTALVGGVPGFYKADGGCDQATVGTKYAEQLLQAGVKVVKYEKPKPAKLADGSVKNLISGYCVADIELVTKAGTVVLPRSHIDVLQGPESANLLYIGEAEEKRLKLRSYAEQLEDLARKGVENGKRKCAKNAPNNASNPACDCTQVKFKENPEFCSPVNMGAAERPRTKAAINGKPIVADGEACVGKHNWKVLRRTPYIFEPLAQECYITTAALRGCEVKPSKDLPEAGVGILDLERNVRTWLGIPSLLNGKYTSEVVLPVRVFPDENKDTVRRLTLVNNVVCRVIPSDKPALVIGRRVYHHLIERKEETLELANGEGIDHEGIEHRLGEMLDAARVAGLPKDAMEFGAHMVRKKHYNVWCMKLQPGDVVDLPPLSIVLEDGTEFKLPKPYRRRYTPAETKWWKTRIDGLVKSGVLRPSVSSNLSPSNLVQGPWTE